ncbi:MAG TPA: hypothetical protein VFR85_15965, partial [Anaeromyxobacteraceae bacterium]|nr:hypothetical protein [Anaeromyxobacteraceae bacterium]
MARGVPASVALAAALALAPALGRGQEPGTPPPPTSAEEPAPGAPSGGPSAGEKPTPAEEKAPGEMATPPPPAEAPGQAPAAGEAHHDETPAPGEPSPDAQPEKAPKTAAEVLDTSHAAVEEQLRDLVDWLDRFFGDRRYLEFGPQRSTVRWRSEVRLTDEPRAYPHTSALVDLRLPAAAAWLSRAHLVLSGDGASDADAPGDVQPATELAAGQGRLELRYDLVRQPRTLFYLGGGVRFAWPPDPFVRLRLRQDFPLARSLLARFTPSVFWELSQGFGASAQLDLDQAISRTAVVRASGGTLLSEKSRGLEWGTSLELRAPISGWLAGALGGSMNGAERSPVAVDKYRVFGRLRADVFRQWLFAEVEPEVVWPADPPRGYRTVLGIILRLEVLFVSEA